jgi:tetratricopeptide (TPR) repeat protein
MLLVVWLAVTAAPAQAQESLSRAKAFYASAAYEDALQVLTSLRSSAASSATEATEVAAYQVFCLVALGRADEARAAIEAIVRRDPLFRPSDEQASPRVRTFFEDVRRPLLPDIARVSYGTAKNAYDRKDMALAKAEFDRVIALVDELAAAGNDGVSDLRTLASGFRDLSAAALAPPPPPPPPVEPEPKPAPAPPPPPVPDPNRVYGPDDTDVVKPEVVSRTMPQWRPDTPAEALLENKGMIELLLDETGRVIQATIVESINPRYDPVLLRAAAGWRFVPAQVNGKAVKYRYRIGLQLNKTS